MPEDFQKELAQLINKHSVDNEVGMQDFLLAEYVCENLFNLSLMITQHKKLSD